MRGPLATTAPSGSPQGSSRCSSETLAAPEAAEAAVAAGDRREGHSGAAAPSTASLEAVRALENAHGQGMALCLGASPSADGVLAATGLGYLAHLPAEGLRLVRADRAQPRLDEAYLRAPQDEGLSHRVFSGFRAAMQKGCPRVTRNGLCPVRCPNRCVRTVALIGASDEDDMPEALHRYLRAGFSHGRAVRTMNAEPWIARAEELAVSVSNECERLRQFARFSRLADGTYFCAFKPKDDVVPLTAGHFKRRMGTERFVLADPAHGSLALYKEGRLALVSLSPQEAERLCRGHELAADEPYVRALWKRFYDALALPGRDRTHRGYDLRQSFMPKRLWTYLPELDPRTDTSWTFVPPIYADKSRERQNAGLPSTEARPLLEN